MALLAVVAALVLVMAVAACGGSDDDEGGSTGAATAAATTGGSTAEDSSGGDDAKAAAQANVDAYSKIPEFTLKAEPVDISKAKGKTIFNIPVSSTIPYVAATDAQMQKVAEEHGVKWIQFKNEGNPTQWAAGINQAINQKVDLIVLESGNDPQLVIPQLKRAKAAGIPVITTHLYQNGEEPPASVKDLLAAFVAVPFHESGELSVDYAIAQDGCDGVKDVVIINAEEVPPSNGIVGAMKDRLKERCPDVTPNVINVPVVDWGTKIAPQVQSAVSSNPNVKWVLPIYDSMAIPASAGIRAAGKAGQVRIASYNGTPDVLKLIQDGDIVAADMGENIGWLGHANMDQAFRVLAGGPIIKDGIEATPLRVFDDSNVDETGTPPSPDKGYGDAYVQGYNKLWGVG